MTDPLRLLLLEDNLDDAALNQRALRKAGIDFTALRVDSKEAFIAALTDFRPDIVLADYHLPTFSGLEGLAIIREKSPDTPYILVSGVMGEEFAVDSIKQGATDYVLKDKLARLPIAVQRAMAEAKSRMQRREAQDRLRLLIENSPLCIHEIDMEGRIISMNRAGLGMMGVDAESAVCGMPYLDTVCAADRDRIAELLAHARAGETCRFEFTGEGADAQVFQSCFAPIKNATGEVVRLMGITEIITERKQAEAEIKHLAFFDPLTNLPNRRLLLDRLHQAVASSARSGRLGALLFIDLDNFKTLNDTLGHDIGDLLLKQVALRLSGGMREGDTVARLGGDEFVVMLEDLSGTAQEAATQITAVGEKVLTTLNQPYVLAGNEHRSTPSIGITLFGDQRETVDELLKRADLAMYQAKAAGRNTLRFYDPRMQAAVSERAEVEVDLRQALQENEFLLYYQPQVDATGRITGAEALVRWQHPRRGLLFPAEFICLAEETGLILQLGHWVLETGCKQLVAWAAHPETAHLTLAVNVSARQFHRPDFVTQVLAVLDNSGADPSKLKLELTESLLLEDVEDIIVKMTTLKARGVGFSLDDFGTGYSSLSYLKRLPLDQMKIDRSFVRDILTDSNDAAIARTIVALARNMSLDVIAEGVETVAQRDMLANQDCHAYQGFLFSKPVPVDQFEAWMQAGILG